MRESLVMSAMFFIVVAVVGIYSVSRSVGGEPRKDTRVNRVVMHKWKSRKCHYCERWIQRELPVLKKNGYKVQVIDNLPENMSAPLLSLMKDDKIVVRHTGYLTAEQIMRGDFH